MIESLETGDVNFETLWKQYGGIGRPRDPSGRFVRHKDGMTRDLDLFDPPDESASRNKLKRAKGAGSGDDSAPGVDKSKPRNKLKRKK